jgi:hypothetical protein
MPDPAKSVADIDDVLSSIRRLVAEQPAGGPRAGDRSAPAASEGADRLVLTPSLRVTEPERVLNPATAAPAAMDAAAFLIPRSEPAAPAKAAEAPAAEPAEIRDMPEAAAVPEETAPALDARRAVAVMEEPQAAEPAPEAATGDAPSAEVHAMDGRADEALADGTMADEIVPDETMLGETAADETAVDETAVDETAVDETAADETADHETPGDATPSDLPVSDDALSGVAHLAETSAEKTHSDTPSDPILSADALAGLAPSAGIETDAPEASVDAVPDMPSPDTTPEVASDVTPEAVSDIVADAASDTMPETEPETVPEPEPEQASGVAQGPETGDAEAGATTADDSPGAADSLEDDAAPALGGDGWRPEMRLFDWARPQDAARPRAVLPPSAAEFESDTGDAGWPDASAEGALLGLAAVREAVASDAPAGNVAQFTPHFSRRNDAMTRVNESAQETAEGAAEAAPTPAPEETAADLPETPMPEHAAGAELSSEAAEQALEKGADALAAGEHTPEAAEMPARLAGLHAEAPEPVTASAVADAPDDSPEGTEAHATGADLEVNLDGDDIAAEEVSGWRDEETGATDLPATGDDRSGDTGAALVDAIAAAAVAEGLKGATARLTGLVAAEASTDRPEAGRSRAEAAMDDEGFLDEETLRRIVAEVVREELQGALGQRITRNVRKLVRREIRLVLAADELD